MVSMVLMRRIVICVRGGAAYIVGAGVYVPLSSGVIFAITLSLVILMMFVLLNDDDDDSDVDGGDGDVRLRAALDPHCRIFLFSDSWLGGVGGDDSSLGCLLLLLLLLFCHC